MLRLIALITIAITASAVITANSGSPSAALVDPAVSVDAIPDASNTATSVGNLDFCASASNGATFDIDVVIQNVTGIGGFQAQLLYDPLVVNFTNVNYRFLLATLGVTTVEVGDTVPDSDGTFNFGAVQFPSLPASGSGVLARLTLKAVGPGSSPLDLTNIKLSNGDGNPIPPSDAVTHFYIGPVNDGSVVVGGACADSDADGYTDVAEAGAPLCNNGVNDDNMDDAVIDDGCPGGPPQAGIFSEGQFKIGTNPRGRCGVGAEPGPSADWPADLVSGGIPNSTDKVNLLDLTSFLAPVRHINTSPGHPDFDPRWDIMPGRGIMGQWINIQDLTNLITLAPSMPPFNGTTRAFNGPACTNS